MAKLTTGLGHTCDKCGERITKGLIHKVVVSNTSYDLCDQCNWDLSRWITTKPLQFGDEPLVVK